MTEPELSLPQVRALLRVAVDKRGGMRPYGREVGVSGNFISQVLSGDRLPSQKLLAALGLEAFLVYRRKPSPPKPAGTCRLHRAVGRVVPLDSRNASGT
jgi:hypothetical protein